MWSYDLDDNIKLIPIFLHMDSIVALGEIVYTQQMYTLMYSWMSYCGSITAATDPHMCKIENKMKKR